MEKLRKKELAEKHSAIKIKQLRTERNMTQKEFSEWLEIPLQTIKQWELGLRSAPQWLLKLIEYRCEKSTQGEKINVEDLIPKKKYRVLHTIYYSGEEYYKIYTMRDPNFEADVKFRKEEDKKGYRYNPQWEVFEVYQKI